jgi:hypothetical protein
MLILYIKRKSQGKKAWPGHAYSVNAMLGLQASLALSPSSASEKGIAQRVLKVL